MDRRIETIFFEEMHGDKSFTDNSPGSIMEILFGERYTRKDLRKTWHEGIKHGIEIGLRKASLEGQRIELNNNTTNKHDLEFLEKFYKLADEYGCAIQYHPEVGMIVERTREKLQV